MLGLSCVLATRNKTQAGVRKRNVVGTTLTLDGRSVLLKY